MGKGREGEGEGKGKGKGRESVSRWRIAIENLYQKWSTVKISPTDFESVCAISAKIRQRRRIMT